MTAHPYSTGRYCVAKRRTAAISAAVLALMLWPLLASAYIFPGPYVLELMARNLSGAQSRMVTQQVIIDDPMVSEAPVELTEELRFLLPGQFRSEMVHNGSRRIHLVSRGEELTVIDDRIVAGGQGMFGRYKDVLLYQTRDALHKMLLGHGVDVGIVSLGRFDDQVVYVIGAQYPDQSVSQIWVDKARLLPLRWINVMPGRDGADSSPQRLDFIYRQWSRVDGTWYPMQIESQLNQRTIRTINAIRVSANVVIPGELMSIDYVRALYEPPPEAERDETPGATTQDEVEQTIEDFKKKFEP